MCYIIGKKGRRRTVPPLVNELLRHCRGKLCGRSNSFCFGAKRIALLVSINDVEDKLDDRNNEHTESNKLG